MPMYEISTKGEEAKRLVKAESAAQAIRHCAKDVFTAKTVSKVEDVADLIEAGVRIEKVDAAAVEQKEEPEGGQPPAGEGEGEGEVVAEGEAARGKPKAPPSKDD